MINRCSSDLTDILCPIPELDGGDVVDENGDPVTDKSSKVAETIYFACVNGFDLIGPTEAVCRTDTSWSLDVNNLPGCKGEPETTRYII